MSKILCFFGWHDWLYDHPDRNRGRVCRRCNRQQQLTAVAFCYELGGGCEMRWKNAPEASPVSARASSNGISASRKKEAS
jgi:hypothetical protein